MENALKQFRMTSSDEDLIEIFTKWLSESKTYHDALLRVQKENYQYYIGNQTDKYRVPSYLSDTVENRVFETVETLTPIATANAHQFQVIPGNNEENSNRKAIQLQKVLQRKYETLEIQEKLESVTKNILLYRFGVIKYFWNYNKDDVDVKSVDPRLILIPKLNTSPYELPFVIELQNYSDEEFDIAFPDVSKEVKESLAKETSSIETGGENNISEYQVYETWTDKMVLWICSGKVLDKKENPYWESEEENKKSKKKNVFNNHLESPEKPFIFFTAFRVGAEPLGSISLIEVGLPLQDSINAQKRSIINNLKQMGNGLVLVDSDAMTEEESDNITNEPGLVIRGKGLSSENKIHREPGVQLPSTHFANLQHSEVTFDNILGVHSATRGQTQADTLGQDIMSRQQDFTRLDTITRVLNRGVARLANGLTQMMKMYYTENHVIKLLGESGAVEFINFNQKDIEDNAEIVVKSGVNLPMDEISLRTEAVQLWQLGAIDPVTLYKRLKFPNPEESAKALQLWKQGQLQMESQVRVEESKQTAAAQPVQEKKAGKEGEGRGVESFLDVLTRAKETLGGKTEKPLKKASTKK